jgi:hypothetical protein
MELLDPVDFIISGWECQGFSAARFGEGLNDTRSGLFTDMVRLITWAQSISPTFGIYNWEHPFLVWPERESLEALHVGQALPWRVAPIQCGTMWFICAPTMQLVEQPCTTFNFTIGSEIHHQRPQPEGFSHIGWSKLLQTSYKARETSLVSCEHNKKTKRCLAHLCLLPRSTHLSERWTRPSVLSCFSHLGWTKPKRKRKGYGVLN